QHCPFPSRSKPWFRDVIIMDSGATSDGGTPHHRITRSFWSASLAAVN
ncbi:hypothetical protein A2U01_0079547, partial [Trifolium medium]|nr:hypothetical protein [Trifolium medium]